MGLAPLRCQAHRAGPIRVAGPASHETLLNCVVLDTRSGGLRFGAGVVLRTASGSGTRSWRREQVSRIETPAAASRMPINAPSGPQTAAPTNTAPQAIAGFRSIVRLLMRGVTH